MNKNSAASIRARLLALAKERREDFNFVLTQYVVQRLLYRLSVSEFRDRFLLKGAWLFSIWSDELHRPTRDADFLGFDESDVETLVDTFKRICSQQADDGLVFDTDSIRGVEIKEDSIYPGVRITGYAYLAKARIAIQIDIAYGDAVTPAAETAQVPVFLDLPVPELRVYTVYTVIAEKFQAMVALGLANSRMKDFYDIWRIAQMMAIDGNILLQAIRATFKQRTTQLDGKPLFVFSEEFRLDNNKQKLWQAFLYRNKLKIAADFAGLIEQLKGFLEPVSLVAGEKAIWDKKWSPEKSHWMDL